MALVLQDRVKESSSSSGTGSVVLTGAFTGFRTFASCIPNGSTVYYCIHNLAVGSEGEWEVGLGTYTLSTTTLARTTVLSSSNAGSLVNFTSGANGLEVFITYPAEKAIYEEANGETLINGGPITVVGSNVTSLPTLPAELGKFVGNINSFAQIYNLNQNSGTDASADFVAYNGGTDVNGTTFFVDMVINSPNYSSVDYPILTANSSYLIAAGDFGSNPSDLYVGSGDGEVKLFAGAFDSNNIVATLGTDLSTTLAGSLNVATTLNVTGATTFGNTVTLNANPTTNLEAATKQYVDNKFANTALTGVPTAPTPNAGDSSTQIATTAFVSSGLSGLYPYKIYQGNTWFWINDTGTGSANLSVDGSTVSISRQTEFGVEEMNASLPVVVSVVEKINEPRYPSFKGIMAAKKKPLETKSLSDVGASAQSAWSAVKDANALPPRSTGIKIEDDGSAGNKLADFLAERRLV